MTIEELNEIENDALETDWQPDFRDALKLAKAVREALAQVQMWEDGAQKVVALFDPLNPRVSLGVLSAVAQGVKAANKSLSADVERLREAARRIDVLGNQSKTPTDLAMREIRRIIKEMVAP